jgi:hypothetical protein
MSAVVERPLEKVCDVCGERYGGTLKEQEGLTTRYETRDMCWHCFIDGGDMNEVSEENYWTLFFFTA